MILELDGLENVFSNWTINSVGTDLLFSEI